MTRRALVTPRLPELRSGNAEIDRRVAQYLQEFVTTVSATISALTPEQGEFAPTWTGFSADPTGNIHYMDFGALVVMWTSAALSGTSDDTGFSLSGVPFALWPTTNRLVRCYVINGGFTLGGGAEVTTTGIVQFYIEDTAGGGAGTADDNKVTPQGTGFQNTGTKGLPAGWIIQYAK